MATTLYLTAVTDAARHRPPSGTSWTLYYSGSSAWGGQGYGWSCNVAALSSSRGATATSISTNTVAGPITGGLDLGYSATFNSSYTWNSAPLAADVTISGSISVTLWGYENSMSANGTLGCRVFRLDGDSGVHTLVGTGAGTAEVGTSATAITFSISPTSTNFYKGDRIAVMPFWTDPSGATMASSYLLTFRHNGPTASADGDSLITFTETLTFNESASGSYAYLTNVASDVSTASLDVKAFTSRGSGVTTYTTIYTGGQLTNTSGGTVVDWFTPTLTAVTLAGVVEVNVRGRPTYYDSYYKAWLWCEIAIVDGDGTNPVVWSKAADSSTPGGTTEYLYPKFLLSGPDYSIATGQRIRIRFTVAQPGQSAGREFVFYFNSGSAGSSGDSWLRFPVTLTEGSSGPTTVTDDFTVNAVLLKGSGNKSFTIDAYLIRHTEANFSVNATVFRHWDKAFAVDAVQLKTMVPSIGEAPGGFFLDATVADPSITGYGFFNVWAIKLATITPTPGSADAVILRTQDWSLTVSAWIAGRALLDAVVIRTMLPAGFSLDAYMDTAWPPKFRVDAVIARRTFYGIDRIIHYGGSGFYGQGAAATGQTVPWSTLLNANGNAVGSRENGQLVDTTSWDKEIRQTRWRWPVFPVQPHWTILEARIALGGYSDSSTTDFTVEVYEDPFTYDFNGYMNITEITAMVAAKPLLATFNTADFVVNGWNLFTDEDLAANLATTSNPGTTGRTEVVMISDRNRQSIEPTGYELVKWRYYGEGSTWQHRIYVVVQSSPGILLDAWITEGGGKVYASLQVAAVIYHPDMPGTPFTINALIEAIHRSGSFVVDAIKHQHFDKTFAVDALISYKYFHLNAFLALRPQLGAFVVSAFISRNTFTLDAVVQAGGLIHLNALVNRPMPASFTVAAWVFNGTTRERTFLLDAVQRATISRKAYIDAVLERLVTARSSSATVDALLLDSAGSSFSIDAVIGSRYGSFAVSADIRGASEKRGLFVLYAAKSERSGGAFTVDATVGGKGRFSINAKIASWFTVNAEIFANRHFHIDAWKAPRPFTLNATIRGTMPSSFTVAATVASSDGAFPGHEGSFTLNAIVAGQAPTPPFTLDALISITPGHGFTLDAWKAAGFTLDAFIQPWFTINAYIRGNDIVIWPPEQEGGDGSTPTTGTFTAPSAAFTAGMVGSVIVINGVGYSIVTVVDANTVTVNPPIASGQSNLAWSIQPDATDPDGNPLPDWFKAARSYRISITLDDVDVTGDVIWRETSFTQNAKTNPGTFELVLRGAFGFDGGEEVLVSIDDFRAFGGYVLSVEHNYVFGDSAGTTRTVLRGADFNVLFDKLIVYNKASVDDPKGSYTNWRNFTQGSLDTKIINKVFSSYVDLPEGFNYTTFVETVGTAAPEKPWAMPTPGSPLRQVMQSISQVTNAVWWIDPYLHLHYGSRTDVTAPFPITDGLGGISSSRLSMSEDMSRLVTETVLWGTLAYTVEGEVRAAHRYSAAYDTIGIWQYGEFRSDLHHTAYINRRADSIIERYGEPIKKAKAVIFDPGFQAGQVADVRLTSHGIAAPLVIRQLNLVFAVAKEPKNGYWYGVPRYELEIGLDPEDPWDIYDYLPFPDDPGTPYEPVKVRVDEFAKVVIDNWDRDIPYAQYAFISERTSGTGQEKYYLVSYHPLNEPGDWVDPDQGRIFSLIPYPYDQAWTPAPYIGYNVGVSSDPGSLADRTVWMSSWNHLPVPYGTKRIRVEMNMGTGPNQGASGDEEGGTADFYIQRRNWGDTLRDGSYYTVCETMLDDGEFVAYFNIPPLNGPNEPLTNTWPIAFEYNLYPGQTAAQFAAIPRPEVDTVPVSAHAYNDQPWKLTFYGYASGGTATGGWGSTSGSSDPWQTGGGLAEFSVDGTGICRLSPIGGTFHGIASLNEGGSRWGSSYTGSGVPDELFTGTQSSFTIDVSCDHWDQARVIIGLYNGAQTAGLEVILEKGTNNRWRLQSTSDEDEIDDNGFTFQDGAWYRVKVQIVGSAARAKVWSIGNAEPGWQSFVDVVSLPWTPGEFALYFETASAVTTMFRVDNFVRAGNGVAESSEGETYGAVGQGWNWETLYVENGLITTTARVTRGTVVMYDENGGFLLPRDDWSFADGGGQNINVTAATSKVTIGYRAWIVNVRSEYSVPRNPNPSDPRRHYLTRPQ